MRTRFDPRETAERVTARAPLSWLAALATAGIVAGHTLTYWAVAPGPVHRDALLAATGHTYWHAAVAVAVVATMWAVSACVARNVRWVLSPGADGRLRQGVEQEPGGFATRLVLLQVTGFVVMEIAERAAAGAPLSTTTLFAHGTLLLGVVAQVAVALVVAGSVDALGRATRRLAARFAPASRRPRAVTVRRASPPDRVPTAAWWRPCAIRGPPKVSSSLF